MPPLNSWRDRMMWKLPDEEREKGILNKIKWWLIAALIASWLVILGTNAYALETGVTDAWNFDLVKMQKNQLFGWNYQGNYETWFGIKGYGFGLNWGYAGVVFGKKKSLDDLVLPSIFDSVSIDEFGNEVRTPSVIKMGDLYLDTFTYINFAGMSAYGLKDIGKWLFWEVALWYGK